ncbi:MAG: dephospho-CoA kinase [Sphingobacteriaceae bacterium]
MLKIGITGGIGSGKTTVAKVFEVLGIPVFYADLVAKELMLTNVRLRKNLVNAFGNATYRDDGSLNREYLAQLVFSQPEELAKLNELVHPAVFKAFDEWVMKQSSPYVVKEAALLFESGSFKLCDYTLLVISPEEIKIKRLMKRDHAKRQDILARMAKQMTDKEKEKLANEVLINNEQKLLIPQILALHQQFLQGGMKKA